MEPIAARVSSFRLYFGDLMLDMREARETWDKQGTLLA